MKATKLFLSIVLPLCFVICGCASKAKTQAQIRRAYAAGEQAARAQMQQNQQQAQQAQTEQLMEQTGDPQIKIVGTVKNPVLTWSDSA